MSTFLDVRETEKTQVFIENFQRETCKISHLMAVSRVLSSGAVLPDGVEIFRKEPEFHGGS